MFQVWAKTTTTQSIKILIVPGHDDEVWGAQYGNIKEADMNLVLGTQIYNNLKKDKRFKVYITRNKYGYTKDFAEYFSKEKENIISFKENAKKETEEKILKGDIVKKTNVAHVSASADMAIKLYGINKWANENKIDLVLHVHFNDYPRSDKWTIGEHKGIAIYVPEKQMVNYGNSKIIAENVFKQLRTKYVASTYEKEKDGVIEDQNLIATGSRGTLDSSVRSILVEYGYIYGKIFRNTTTRHKAYKDMASLTTKGIVNSFYKK
jgi:N-acetylmuramoyl-L-alanine amidase